MRDDASDRDGCEPSSLIGLAGVAGTVGIPGRGAAWAAGGGAGTWLAWDGFGFVGFTPPTGMNVGMPGCWAPPYAPWP